MVNKTIETQQTSLDNCNHPKGVDINEKGEVASYIRPTFE